MGLKTDLYQLFGQGGDSTKMNAHVLASALGIGLVCRASATPDKNVRIAEQYNVTLSEKAFSTLGVTTSTIITNIDSEGELTVDVETLVGGSFPDDTILIYAYKDVSEEFNIGYYDTSSFTPGNPATYPSDAHYPIAEIVLASTDTEILQSAITDVRPMFDPRAGGISPPIGNYWIWDEALTPLDTATFLTGLATVTPAGSLREEMLAVASEESNAKKINDNFVDGLQMLYGLAPRANGTLNLTLTEGYVTISGNKHKITEISSPDFTPPTSGTETHLLYARSDGAVVEYVIVDSGFTPGDPNTYYDIDPGMYPICEVSISNGDTEIIDSDITDVRPLMNSSFSGTTLSNLHKAIVAGGYDGASTTSLTEIYDDNADTWTEKNGLPLGSERTQGDGASVDTNFYLVNGYVGSPYARSILNTAYLALFNAWAARTSTPTPTRDANATAAAAETVYNTGGYGTAYLSVNQQYVPTTDAWGSKTAMLSIRGRHALASTEDYLYSTGGYISSTYSNNCDQYSVSGDSWVNKTSMTTPRYTHTAQQDIDKEKIYVYGGHYSGGVTASAEEYNTIGDSWATKTAMPAARFAQTGATLSSGIYAFNGGSAYNADTNAYDPDTDTWIAKADSIGSKQYAQGDNLTYSEPQYSYNQIAVYGGRTPTQLKDTNMYNTDYDHWTSMADDIVASARDTATASTVANKGYVISGQDSVALLTNNQFDPSTNNWSARTDMSSPARVEASSVEMNDNVYVFGGQELSGGINDVDVYNPVGNSWLGLTDSLSQRSGAAGTNIGDLAYYTGGFDFGTTARSALHEEYSRTGNSWASRTSMGEATRYCGGFSDDSHVYIPGGNAASGSFGYSDKLEIWTQSGDSWAAGTSMPSPGRDSQSVESANGLGFSLSGRDAYGAISDNSAYISVTDSWVTKTPDLTARYFVCGSPFDFSENFGYTGGLVFGGYGTAYTLQTDRYSASNDAWTTLTDMVTPARNSNNGALVNNKAYSFGGYGGSVLLDNDYYTQGLDAWASATNLPVGTYGHAAAGGGLDYGYMFGGLAPSATLSARLYSEIASSWYVKTSMPSPSRYYFSAAYAPSTNSIYTSGGINATGYADMDEYSTTEDSWASKTDMSTAISNHSSVELDGNVYVPGGWSNTTIESIVQRYNILGDSWAYMTDLLQARIRNGASSGIGNVYVYGGKVTTSATLSLTCEEYNVGGDSWAAVSDMPSPTREWPGCVSI